ncbi:Hypothetical protein NGAL_HAMBI1145_20310 [Neorhizobium galegae bv. officinalis]|jgi:hypothetical protein|uniref:Uncharacterized protein n=1 Tax=Neorhizobium galegae bv. officinalis TaxID=323656 RepID=A0A0T7GKL5_NEOGA|nr:hypothetical protein [Neorhizobium galegae]CDZ33889.1 Hypothetical protein NGAL_HAMBI1145_20310 [Neorhizobium galegae bv. officinalis]CDZ47821.1 Hypothetical protein NGAL_HAMBI1189_21010 [Neorhizobium galegae bv. officinalis]
MTVVPGTPSPNSQEDVNPRIDDLIPWVHRMAGRFVRSDREAGALADRTIIEAKLQLPLGQTSQALRLQLFRLMLKNFAAHSSTERNRS